MAATIGEGWHWAIVLATGLLYFVIVGVETCFGQVLEAILSDEGLPGVSRSLLTWVQCLALFLELALGLAPRLFDEKRARLTLVVGGALICAGMELSALVTEAWHLVFSYGITVGLGLGIVFVGASHHMHAWTQNKPAAEKASLECVAGILIGLGIVVGAAIIRVAIVPGWRSCLQVLGAVCGAIVLLAASVFVEPLACHAKGCSYATAHFSAASAGALAAHARQHGHHACATENCEFVSSSDEHARAHALKTGHPDGAAAPVCILRMPSGRLPAAGDGGGVGGIGGVVVGSGGGGGGGGGGSNAGETCDTGATTTAGAATTPSATAGAIAGAAEARVDSAGSVVSNVSPTSVSGTQGRRSASTGAPAGGAPAPILRISAPRTRSGIAVSSSASPIPQNLSLKRTVSRPVLAGPAASASPMAMSPVLEQRLQTSSSDDAAEEAGALPHAANVAGAGALVVVAPSSSAQTQAGSSGSPLAAAAASPRPPQPVADWTGKSPADATAPPVPAARSQSARGPVGDLALGVVLGRLIGGANAQKLPRETTEHAWGVITTNLYPPAWWAFAACMALVVTTNTVVETHFGVAAIQDYGATQEDLANYYFVWGMASLVSRVAMSLLFWHYEVRQMMLVQVFGILCGLGVCMLAVFGSYPGFLYVFAAWYGALSGPSYQFSNGAIGEIFDVDGHPDQSMTATAAQTMTVGFRALPVLLSAPLAAYVRDASTSYAPVWVSTGAVYVACAMPIMLLGLHPSLKRAKAEARQRRRAELDGMSREALVEELVHKMERE